MATLEAPITAPPQNEQRRRVVVGVDGSSSSLRALRWASEHAERIGASLDVVTVWQLPTTYGWALRPSAEGNPARHAKRLLDEELDAVFGDRRPPTMRTHVVEGHPATTLLAAAEGADLLVVGSRGMGVFASTLAGSVSAQCAHHATCPVTIIRG
jgi:nucleotide-binding universal stress UspA family protein